MEYNPIDPSELEDDDDDEAIEKKKRTTRIPRYAPHVKVEADAKAPAPERPKTIGERFLQLQMKRNELDKEDKKESDHDELEASEERAETQDEETRETFESRTEPTLKYEADKESSDQNTAQVEAPEQEEVTSAMEAADWEREGELQDEGEIAIGRSHEEPEESEEAESFAEMPPAPEPDAETVEPQSTEVEPELLEAGLGAEGPPPPPEDTPVESGPTPEPPRFAARDTEVAAPERPWYDAAAADRERQRSIEEAEHYAERRGVRKGLGAGLLFGWLFGRHGKKKQAREFEKQIKTKDSEIKSLKNEQQLAQTRIEALKTTQANLESNIQEHQARAVSQAEKGPQTAPRAPEHVRTAVSSAESTQPAPAEKIERTVDGPLRQAAETLAKAPEFAAAVVGAALERRSTIERSPAERAPIKPEAEKAELLPEERPITEETYQAPAGRRVETSAWHRIEVDEKTGKAVENPEIAYGEEFQRERRQETLKEDKQRAVALGGGGAAAPIASQLGGLATSTVPKGDGGIDPSAPYQQSSDGNLHVPAMHQDLKVKSELLRYASKPTVWVIAVVIVVVLFAFGILR